MNSPRSRKKPVAPGPDPFAVQQELSPAAATVTEGVKPANDEARQSIAVIQTELAKVDAIEAGIADLEKKYTNVVYDCAIPAQMQQCKEALKDIQTPRFNLENARKAAKRPIIDMGRQIDGRAEKIKERLLKLENPLVDMKEKAEKAERERKDALEKKLTELRNTPQQCIGKTVAQLEEVLEALDSLPLADFQEYREQAAKAQLDAQMQVRQLLTSARQAEELADLRRKQWAEEDRKVAHRLRTQESFTAVLNQLPMCRTSARVDQLIAKVQAVEVTEVWEEFAPAAREEKARVLAALTAARDEKLVAEKAREGAGVATGMAARTVRVAVVDTPSAVRAAAVGASLNPPAIGLTPGDVADAIERTLDAGLVQEQDPHGFGTIVDDKTGPAPASHDAQLAGYEFVTGQRLSDERSIESPSARPTDAELLGTLAAHYEVPTPVVATWLRSMDIDAALAQLQLGV